MQIRAFLTLALPILLLSTGCTEEPGRTPAGVSPLRIAAVFTTPIEEPWDHVIHQALLRAQDSLHVLYDYEDGVEAEEFEGVLTELANQGFDVIFGDAFSAEEAVRRVAAGFPDIAFVFGSGLGPTAPNLSVFDNWIHEPAYLAGMIAGELTKSGVIGVVGGYPVPEVNRITNAFLAGAREVAPTVSHQVAFIDSWFDPPKAEAMAYAMIDGGVDVLYAERDGVIEAAAARDIPVFGNLIDQQARAPHQVVTSVLWDMWPTVHHVIEGVSSGSYSAEDLGQWSMMAKGGSSLAPFRLWGDRLSGSLVQRISQRADAISGGRFRVTVNEADPRF